MKMKMVFVVAVAMLVSCTAAFAQGGLPEIVSIKGDPKIMKKDSGAWMSCAPAMAVASGDRIKTAAGEAVELMFLADKSNMIGITENSDVVVLQSNAPCSVELVKGEVLALMKNIPKGSTFEVRTPAGISGARGTGWSSSTDGEKAVFSSYEDSIYVKGVERDGSAMAEELIVNEGFRTVIDKFERPERIEQLSRADIERWNGFRQEVTGRALETVREKTERAAEVAETKAERTAEVAAEKTEATVEKAERTIEKVTDRLDRIAREETQIERLEAKKQDIQETRDISQISAKEEAREPTREPAAATSVSADTGTSDRTISKGE